MAWMAGTRPAMTRRTMFVEAEEMSAQIGRCNARVIARKLSRRQE
jgi:hypothetical protein